MIETTGEGKSAVATPDGKSRKKKKKIVIDDLRIVVDDLHVALCSTTLTFVTVPVVHFLQIAHL